MSTAPPSQKRRLPWNKTTLVVFAFLTLTILPAFIAFAMTPQDAQVVTSVQGWNGCAYTVRRGENLFRIGVRYGVTYQYLAQLNGIYNPNYVWAGQVISVPCGDVPPIPYNQYSYSSGSKYPPYQCPWCQPFTKPDNCGNTIQYTVAAGDNLFRIAVNNGSTIQWIRTDNNLWGKVLRPGVTLQVPCQGYVKYGPNIFTPTPGGGGIITATPITPPTVQPSRVRMSGGLFRPASLAVRVGTTVTWVNNEQAGGDAYSVTSGVGGTPNGLFDSGLIQPGGTFQFTFTTPGNYGYYSITNPTGMTGEIIVNP
jgi:plastocyanin/LysM repeat protein